MSQQPKQLLLTLSLITLLFACTSSPLAAQTITVDTSETLIAWQEYELTGAKSKLEPKGWFRWWYVPVVAIPPTVYLLLTDDDPESPVPPPSVNCLPDFTLPSCQSAPPLPDPSMITATNFCSDGDLSIVHTVDIERGGSGCVGDQRTIERIYTITDACGNSVNCTQIFTYPIDETAPVLNCPADMVISCEDDSNPLTTGEATATDDCTNSGNISITSEDDLSGLDQCNGTGTLRRTWTATDNCGNSSTCVQTITVEDATAPVFTETPTDITVDCSNVPPPSQVVVTDNCQASNSLNILLEELISPGCPFTITRTWRAVDACGNSSTFVQVITVEDTTAPVFTDTPTDLTVDCSDIPPPYQITATDDCTSEDDLMITLEEEFGDGCPYNIIRTWTATDECGNSSSYTQIITVVDNTAPILSCPVDAYVICGESTDPALTGFPLIEDDCSDFTLSYIDDLSNQDECSGFISRTFEVVDECGNLASCDQIIWTIPNDCDFMPKVEIDEAACNDPNGQITIAAEPGFTYSWSNGETGPIISNLTAGTYTVTIVNGDLSCSQTLPIVVPEAPPYELEVSSVSNPSGPGAADGVVEFVIATANTTPPYIIYLNGSVYGFTTNAVFEIEGLSAGVYSVFVVDANDCMSEVIAVTLVADPGLRRLPIIHLQSGIFLTPNLPPRQTDEITEPAGWIEHPTLATTVEFEFVPEQQHLLSGSWHLQPNVVLRAGLGLLSGHVVAYGASDDIPVIHLDTRFQARQGQVGIRKSFAIRQWQLFTGVDATWSDVAVRQNRLTLHEQHFGLPSPASNNYFNIGLNGGISYPLGERLAIELSLVQLLTTRAAPLTGQPQWPGYNCLLDLKYRL